MTLVEYGKLSCTTLPMEVPADSIIRLYHPLQTVWCAHEADHDGNCRYVQTLAVNTPIATKATIEGSPTNEIKFEGTGFPTGSTPVVEYRGATASSIWSHTENEVVAFFLQGVPVSIIEDNAKPTLSFKTDTSKIFAAEDGAFVVEGSALLIID